MDFRILGPVEVSDDGRPVALGGRKQRAVLALLLLNANRVLSRDWLIDRLWDGEPPPTAATALQGHVSSLRKALGAGVIETRSPGYVIEVRPEQVDLNRFEDLRGEARTALERGDPGKAAERLRAALELWQGEALADVRLEPALEGESARLDDLRLTALEDRIDADLAAGGRDSELVGELDGLLAAHPLRERLWGQLMLALYRSGRQADALDAYRRARHRLIAELGIEPAQSLRDLERAILAQDPVLDPPPRPSTARARARRRLGLALAGLALVAAVAGAALASRGSSDPPAVPASGLAVVDAASGELVDAVPLDIHPGPVAVGAGGVWALDAASRSRTAPSGCRCAPRPRPPEPAPRARASPRGGPARPPWAAPPASSRRG
jgi:DNA-binding SARP family transcriptional activator